ncbi:alpha/beta hydrolase [Kitasatospora sp. NA04385]|uniref:alpha/beta fold hydrolase n=1 Tax=Kitasatospora sp. NA04385 TaxID=2742135 RepID=UPI00159140F9|nr:alpha/beta hydrolase [Kitasatospora sp. NA04385]QKW23902.1 alpha/beta hydrolase [Kitasatospora sp. NA04385]
MRESVLEVPGARLRHFVRGAGPVLLLVAGGHGDAGATDALAARLADRYTVVTYDRRGLSGSTVEEPERTTVAVHADDVSRLLAALTPEPALVFGSSLGGLVALEFAIRHPGRVRTVVAHEPAAVQLLPEPERASAVRDLLGAREAFEAAGVDAALRRFARFAGIDPADREPDAPARARGPEQVRNAGFLLRYDVPTLPGHLLDLGALKGSGVRVVAGVGENSGRVWPRRCGELLAAELGVPCAGFPGGHNGYAFRPRGTAERLHEVLSGHGEQASAPGGGTGGSGRPAAV